MSEDLPRGADRHRLRLRDGSGQWDLWRHAGVRGAGFALAEVLRLASPAAAASADRLDAAQAAVRDSRCAALAAVERELELAHRSAAEGSRRALQKLRKELKKGRSPAVADLPASVAMAVERCAAAADQLRRASEQYLARFSAEAERLSGEVCEIARGERFREAVLWQNRRLAQGGIASLLAQAPGKQRSSKLRRNQHVVASYLQRFCAKNDTIGFFGPVGWATLGAGTEPLVVRHGHAFLAERRVFYEGWCIDAIAAALLVDGRLKLSLAPRRAPFVRADGEVAGRAGGPGLAPGVRAVLALCDGKTPARLLLEQLVAAGSVPDTAAAYAMLEQLQQAGLLRWGFEVPMSLAPDRALYRQVESLEPAGAARQLALGTLDELEAHRLDVERAAGDPCALDAALQRLERRFTELTGLAPTRAHGRTYAGRTLVFEDCRRGTEIELGEGLLAALAPPLGLMLTSARWLTFAAAALCRQLFEAAYRELRQETGCSQVELLAFCRKALPPIVPFVGGPIREQLLPRFQRRWAEVLGLKGDGARRLHLRSEAMRSRVQRAFAAPQPGWSTARWHSPDVLIAAEGVDAIRRGDCDFVLGELHVGINSLATNLFASWHPSPAELVAAMERDLPEPCVVPILRKSWQQDELASVLGATLPGLGGRSVFAPTTAKDVFVAVAPASPDLPLAQVLSVADLSVEPGVDGLQVVSREGSHRFALLDFMQTVITHQVMREFRILGPGPHLPRVTIDRLVIWRESWSVRAGGLEFARAPTEAQRFSGARRWARGLHLPRFVFVRSPHQVKPFFLDLESPLSVEIFSREARESVNQSGESSTLEISEMLPGPAECWFPDAEGRKYTCELRLVAVDRSA